MKRRPLPEQFAHRSRISNLVGGAPANDRLSITEQCRKLDGVHFNFAKVRQNVRRILSLNSCIECSAGW